MASLSTQLTFVQSVNTSTTATTVALVYPQMTTGNLTFISNQEKGDGYFGSSDGLHTVAYTVTQNFIGEIKMQGTLATNPIDVSSTQTDWFDIAGTDISYPYPGSNNTQYANFTGLFVWVRGVVTFSQGSMHSISYNH
jgi:hypothetical protein